MAWRANPILNVDVYKISHKRFTAKGTTRLYSNLTARSFKRFLSRFPNSDMKLVWFGMQFVLKKLNDDWNELFFSQDIESVMFQVQKVFKNYIGPQDLQHFRDLHALGYLPIKIKALPEGSLVNEKIPLFTITNTHDDYQWLVNYLETYISSCIWKLITIATVSREFRKLSNEWALKTVGSTAGTEFQNHDFSFRGQDCPEFAAAGGGAFLTCSSGTDTASSLDWLEYYYNVDLNTEFTAASVNASEHSVSCLGSAVMTELGFYKNAITEQYKTGIVSLVMDTYNYWEAVAVMVPSLKEEILARQPDHNGLAKVVVRGDSGDPVHIIAGYRILDLSDLTKYSKHVQLAGSVYIIRDITWKDKPVHKYCNPDKGYYEVVKFPDGKYYKLRDAIEGATPGLNFKDIEARRNATDTTRHVYATANLYEICEAEAIGTVASLWNTFGGTITSEGYKLLHERIGTIYGDSITFARAEEIYMRLADKNFASLNVVFGIGSFSLTFMTRDELGMAIKATMALVDDMYVELFKDPITDDGTKKSAKGFLRVEKDDKGNFILFDQQTLEQEDQGELQLVYENSIIYNEVNFQIVKSRIWV